MPQCQFWISGIIHRRTSLLDGVFDVPVGQWFEPPAFGDQGAPRPEFRHGLPGMLQVRAEPGSRSLVLTPGFHHAGGDEGTHEAGHGGFGLHECLGLGGFVVPLVLFHHLDSAHEVIGGRL
jgi:hypothetical protein